MGADEYIYRTEGRTVPGNIAHHIIPARENPGKRLDADNIIYVSRKTHEMIHAAYDAGAQEKMKMIRKLQAIRARGRGKKVFANPFA